MTKGGLFAYFPYASSIKFQNIIDQLGSIDAVFFANQKDLLSLPTWTPKNVSDFISWRNNIDENKLQLELDKEGIEIIDYFNPNYPNSLKNLYDPPIAIFVRGNLTNNFPKIAIVGTRKPSSYGIACAKQFGQSLAEADISIVSGLAYGIDAISHEAALSKSGHTIAVLGSGIDKKSVTPRHNYLLSEKIINTNGALISEYPPGTEATNYSFPKRNRIIAALSSAVLIVEAGVKSGSLITAKLGLELGKEIFAIPHPINSISIGTNNLIKEGASLVNTPEDILNFLNIIPFQINKTKLQNLIPDEQQILDTLSRQPQHIDQIINRCKLEHFTILACLTSLELKGLVQNIENGKYILN